MKPKRSSLLNACDKFPPFLVIFMAKDRRKRIPIEELSRRTGISTRTLFRLRSRVSWGNVPVWIVEKLTSTCGFDIISDYRKQAFMRNMLARENPFQHLPKAQADLCVAKMKEYVAAKRGRVSQPVNLLAGRRNRVVDQ